MRYNTYSAEYKITLIEEYKSRGVSIRRISKEKNIPTSTLFSWIKKSQKYGDSFVTTPVAMKKNDIVPIDVTGEVKGIVKEESAKTLGTFTLETKGMILTFPITNIKEVLEEIKHD